MFNVCVHHCYMHSKCFDGAFVLYLGDRLYILSVLSAFDKSCCEFWIVHGRYAEQTKNNCFHCFCFIHGFEYFRLFHYCWFSSNKYARCARTKYNWNLGIPYSFLSKWHIIKCTMDWDQRPINKSLFGCSHFTGENGETN